MKIEYDHRLGRGQNERGHWRKAHTRASNDKEFALWNLRKIHSMPPPLPCIVTLTRIAPSKGLDRDNLIGSMKATRDAVALWTRVDDAREDVVEYRYEQERGAWGVRIEVKPK